MAELGWDPYKTAGIEKQLKRRLRQEIDYRIGHLVVRRITSVVQDIIEWRLNPCPHHGYRTRCQVCDPMPQKIIDSLNNQRNRWGNYRHGCAPLRKRRKRLHKKLAKRGFSASPSSTIWSSPTPGYGVQDTEYDFLGKKK